MNGDNETVVRSYRITLAHIVVVVCLALLTGLAGVVTGWYSLSSRVGLNEQALSTFMTTQRTIDTRQDIEIAESRRQNREDYKNINDKLDTLINRIFIK